MRPQKIPFVYFSRGSRLTYDIHMSGQGKKLAELAHKRSIESNWITRVFLPRSKNLLSGKVAKSFFLTFIPSMSGNLVLTWEQKVYKNSFFLSFGLADLASLAVKLGKRSSETLLTFFTTSSSRSSRASKSPNENLSLRGQTHFRNGSKWSFLIRRLVTSSFPDLIWVVSALTGLITQRVRRSER